MSGPLEVKDALPVGLGLSGASFPLWDETVIFFAGANATLISLFGVLILAVTLWTKIVDLMIKRRQLRKMNATEAKTQSSPEKL